MYELRNSENSICNELYTMHTVIELSPATSWLPEGTWHFCLIFSLREVHALLLFLRTTLTLCKCPFLWKRRRDNTQQHSNPPAKVWVVFLRNSEHLHDNQKSSQRWGSVVSLDFITRLIYMTMRTIMFWYYIMGALFQPALSFHVGGY